MRITRRRFLELAAAAAPAAVVGCAASHGASEPIEPSRILDLDGRRASFDRDGANSVIRNQVDAGVRGPVGVRGATLPEPTPAGWRFTASNSMVAEILPSLDQFGLMVVVDAAGGATGRICTVGDASGSTLQLVLAAPDTLAVWWADVEVLRVQEASIRQRSCVFAVTVDSARIVHGFLNGAHAATSTRAVGLRGVQRLTLGSDGPDRSFTGVLQQLRCWDRAVSGTLLRRNFDVLGSTWGASIVPLIGHRHSSAQPVPMGLKGSCVIPKASDIDNGSAWQNFWSRWDWPWAQESIDLAVEAGSRSIRIIGDVGALILGSVDATTYRRRLDQLVTYCRRRGLTVYYCLLDLRHTPLGRLAEVEPLARMIVRRLSTHDNVVAIELCNEVSVIYPQMPKETVFAFVSRWAAAIRHETNLPLSVSDVRTGTLIEKLTDRTEMSRWREVVDFFDIHVYRPPRLAPGTNYLAPYELATDIPLVFGEAGASRDDDPDRAGTYRTIEQLATSSDRVCGVYQWGLINDEYGLMTETGRVRQSAVLAEWRTFEPRA